MSYDQVLANRRAADLCAYFSVEGPYVRSREPVGVEVETSFVTAQGMPISVQTSQRIFAGLAERGWRIVQRKGGLITVLENLTGDKLLYELGRQNIELATCPKAEAHILPHAQRILDSVYAVALESGAYPFFGPMLTTAEDLLVIPDERDAGWVLLDGREALRPLATISAVQFTVEVDPARAVECLNRLGARIKEYLVDYPQDVVWREYIRSSCAGYREDRYGGPLEFSSVHDYCQQLLCHDVVTTDGLRSLGEATVFDVPLFVRSVWWYFRLRRYGNRLCIEVRPLARRSDNQLQKQLAFVLSTLNL